MLKSIDSIKGLRIIFDPTRKGAKYSLDGEHWFNGGDFNEIARNFTLGLEPKKDANTKWCDGSDALNKSIKSSKATLVSKVLGLDFDSTLRAYFETTASTEFEWCIANIETETLITYTMNAVEFEEFTRAWAGFDNSRKVIRYKSSSKALIKWLDARA